MGGVVTVYHYRPEPAARGASWVIRKVFVSVPSDEPDSVISGVVLSETALADDWLNSEEEAAWAHLQ